jgi:hypothetical protein
MTNICVKELVDFINVFEILPRRVSESGFLLKGVVGVCWTTGHTGRIIIRIRPQHRHCLNSLQDTYDPLKISTTCRNMSG